MSQLIYYLIIKPLSLLPLPVLYQLSNVIYWILYKLIGYRTKVVFTNIRNPRSAIVRRKQYEQTYLEKGSTIGANATIRCGVRLGHHCLIGAGAVVTKDVPAYALMQGVPAQQAGWVSEYGHRLVFDEDGKAFCPESKQKYLLQGNIVSRA